MLPEEFACFSPDILLYKHMCWKIFVSLYWPEDSMVFMTWRYICACTIKHRQSCYQNNQRESENFMELCSADNSVSLYAVVYYWQKNNEITAIYLFQNITTFISLPLSPLYLSPSLSLSPPSLSLPLPLSLSPSLPIAATPSIPAGTANSMLTMFCSTLDELHVFHRNLSLCEPFAY